MVKKRAGKFAFVTIAIYTAIMAIVIAIIIKLNDIHSDISSYREILKGQNMELEMTGRLSMEVFYTLSSGNLYNTSGNREYRKNIERIKSISDSIAALSNDKRVKELTDEIIIQLKNKEKNRKKLETLFNNLNPIEDINRKLKEIEDSTVNTIKEDSLIVSKTVRDTVYKKDEKKNFWRRLGEVFSPNRDTDSIAYISTIKVDTIVTQKKDSLKIISEMITKSEEAKEKYTTDITSIIQEINVLMYNDHNISANITRILMKLQDMRIEQIDREMMHGQNDLGIFFRYMVIVVILVIVCVIILIYLLVKSFHTIEKSNISLEREKERVVTLMKTRHTLLLNVSHDIKAPLSSITGYLSTWDDKDRKEEIESMINSAGYINSLLENLLKFTALEQGRLGVDTYESEINSVLRKIVQMFTSIAKDKGIRTELNSLIAPGTVLECDILKIEQIIINLVSNAIKYSHNGTVRIDACLRNDGNGAANAGKAILEVSVSDEGIGIESDKLDHLFELFSRLEDGKKISKGDGVGMFVVKGLVDLLGGKIEVDSEKGKGSRFTISIPVEITGTDGTCMEKETSGALKSGECTIRAAIVDDDNTILKIYSAITGKLGIRCDMYSSLEEIAKGLENNEYDMILSDWEIGTSNGFDVLALARNKDAEKGRKTFVFGVTGRTDISEQDAVKLGFDGIYYKPVTLEKISDAIKRVSIEAGFSIKTAEAKQPVMTFREMFADDPYTLAMVLETFINTSRENLASLQMLLDKEAFGEAAALAHKMKPSFMQSGAGDELTAYLQKMDASRADGEESFPDWKKETPAFIEKAGAYIEGLAKTTLQS